MTLSCDQARARIDAPHGLAAADQVALAAHLATCDACRSFAALEARIAPAFALTPDLRPSPRLTAALMAVPVEASRRRAFAYVPLAWGSLAAVALVAIVTWFARMPGSIARLPDGDRTVAPTAASARGAASVAEPAAKRADLGGPATAAAVRRATPMPTGPLAAAVALLRPAAPTPTPAALALAVEEPIGARDRDRRSGDEGGAAGTVEGEGTGEDVRRSPAATGQEKGQPYDPTPPAPGSPEATDAAAPATPAAPTMTPPPDFPPGALPGTPPAPETPPGPPRVMTPDDPPTSSPTPSATPTMTATMTATPTPTASPSPSATGMPGAGPTATPQPMPTPLGAPW
ncbi:MAG: hypothetical protein IT332_01380 [Ardenticatenales bacterium]|nr:hypothetical protein [Ardenticatenales bacterium]